MKQNVWQQLTDIFRPVVVDDVSELEVGGNDGDLVGRLSGEVQGLLVGAAKQQSPGTGFLKSKRDASVSGLAPNCTKSVIPVYTFI